jgi:hypothetical protein
MKNETIKVGKTLKKIKKNFFFIEDKSERNFPVY